MICVENNQECFVVLWRKLERTRLLFGGQCKRYCIRNVLKAWFGGEATDDFIWEVCRLTGIGPDEPLGIPSDKPSRWMKLGAAMCVQECGSDGLDWIAMLDGWAMARE